MRIRTGAIAVSATLTLFSTDAGQARAKSGTPASGIILASVIAGRSISLATKSGTTVIDVRGPHGKSRSLALRRDAASDPQSPILGARILGEVGESVIVLIDTVQSRPGGLSYCQAGEESTIRVFAIKPKAIAETARFKLDSCIDGIESKAPPPHFDHGKLVVTWLHAPIAGKGPGVLNATIANGGSVQGSVEGR